VTTAGSTAPRTFNGETTMVETAFLAALSKAILLAIWAAKTPRK
jgi:hypothetical protein